MIMPRTHVTKQQNDGDAMKTSMKKGSKINPKSIKDGLKINQKNLKSRSGGVLEASWRRLGASWGVLEAFWGVLGGLEPS